MLNILERVHSTGYIYNDLKLDNIMLDYDTDIQHLIYSNYDIFDQNHVNLIDFGFASRYLSKESKEHINKKKVDVFRGSIIFSSLH